MQVNLHAETAAEVEYADQVLVEGTEGTSEVRAKLFQEYNFLQVPSAKVVGFAFGPFDGE